MKLKKIGRMLAGAALVALSIAAAHAQDYPSKPVRIIVPYPPGATTDILARALGKALSEKWKQPFLVENQGGANGNIGADRVYRAAPDGYTLMFVSPGPLVINKDLYGDLSYDPEKFTSISLVAKAPNVLIAGPRLTAEQAGSLPQLISYAKANPGKLNFASQGNGSTSHLSAEMFKASAGVNLVHVPYKGSAPALTGLLGRDTDFMFIDLSTALPYIKTGQVRALAMASEQPSPKLPGVPTVGATLPGFVATTWFAMTAPPQTPSPLVEKLSQAIAESLRQSDMEKMMADMSLDVVGSTPAAMDDFLKQDRKRWSAAIRATGAHIE
jgi:tripartite-type tricarboxylate transporter receptor subunit TctC